eukprot:gene6406-biopygen13062
MLYDVYPSLPQHVRAAAGSSTPPDAADYFRDRAIRVDDCSAVGGVYPDPQPEGSFFRASGGEVHPDPPSEIILVRSRRGA